MVLITEVNCTTVQICQGLLRSTKSMSCRCNGPLQTFSTISSTWVLYESMQKPDDFTAPLFGSSRPTVSDCSVSGQEGSITAGSLVMCQLLLSIKRMAQHFGKTAHYHHTYGHSSRLESHRGISQVILPLWVLAWSGLSLPCKEGIFTHSSHFPS